jgi:hypothetical protein
MGMIEASRRETSQDGQRLHPWKSKKKKVKGKWGPIIDREREDVLWTNQLVKRVC